MSAVIEQAPKVNAKPTPQPAEPQCPISVALLQAYVDSIVVGLTLPTVNAQAPPLEEYIDENEKDPNKRRKMRPRRACAFDAQGFVVPFSGPVVPDDFALDLWEKARPHVENCVLRALFQMSESLLIAERGGIIDDRSKVIPEIRGRFVVMDE